MNSPSDDTSQSSDIWLKAGRQKCVKLTRLPMLSWQDAEAECQRDGNAHLVGITDQEEQSALEEIVLNR